jgi:hypothetical protein
MIQAESATVGIRLEAGSTECLGRPSNGDGRGPNTVAGTGIVATLVVP